MMQFRGRDCYKKRRAEELHTNGFLILQLGGGEMLPIGPLMDGYTAFIVPMSSNVTECFQANRAECRHIHNELRDKMKRCV